MSTIPGLFVAGEANFSDHGANRLGASALMQGLADGYFILPYTIPNYIASNSLEKVDTSHPAFAAVKDEVNQRIAKLLGIQGKRTVDSFHKELGKLMWENCGMARSADGLAEQPGKNSRVARGILEQPEDHRDGRGTQPVARKGRARGGFPGTCRIDVPRRAGAGRILRRPFPRREPDAGRRSAARRRAISRSCRHGNGRAKATSGNCIKEPLAFEHVHLAQRSYK